MTTPILVARHVVEEGMNNHANKWAIVRVEARFASNGELFRCDAN
jgi:hypothetical protein